MDTQHLAAFRTQACQIVIPSQSYLGIAMKFTLYLIMAHTGQFLGETSKENHIPVQFFTTKRCLAAWLVSGSESTCPTMLGSSRGAVGRRIMRPVNTLKKTISKEKMRTTMLTSTSLMTRQNSRIKREQGIGSSFGVRYLYSNGYLQDLGVQNWAAI